MRSAPLSTPCSRVEQSEQRERDGHGPGQFERQHRHGGSPGAAGGGVPVPGRSLYSHRKTLSLLGVCGLVRAVCPVTRVFVLPVRIRSTAALDERFYILSNTHVPKRQDLKQVFGHPLMVNLGLVLK